MIQFRMTKISISQFAILANAVPVDGMTYTINVSFQCATEAKRIACEFSVEFDSDKPLVKLGVFCEFDIKPEDWDSRVIDAKLNIPKEELCIFANQTVGVARGIMFCKTDGTPFSQLIVPPINLVSLIKDDFTIDLGQEP